MKKTVICLDVHGKKYAAESSELKWRPAAYGIVIKDNCVLLSKQFGHKYDLPGGGLEIGEKLEAGVIREVKEETGIDVANPKLIETCESFFYSSHAKKEYYHSLLFYYSCEYIGGKISKDGFDEWEKQYADLAVWIPIEKLDNLEVASTVDWRPAVKKAAKV
jgi:8-oxo-dGTP diphosphatase